MPIYTTITPKFQVHIPVAIRQKIGLKYHGRALIRVQKRKIVIEPVESDFRKWGGAFKVKKPVPAEHIRDYIDYAFGKR